jgi:serine/threonine-protein kinase
MDNSTFLNALVSRWEELRRQGRSASPEELCAGQPELLPELRRLIRALEALEPFLGAGGSGASEGADGGAPTGPPTKRLAVTQVGRYPVLGELGRGGMGLVLLSSDPALRRDLALKVMRGDCAALPDVVQRFVEEAQVGGQLQHPGVVPVYELGNTEDGRPYFTMKLVKGQTLSKLLRERPDPSHERVRFLKVFEQVCQAVAYAHSKGVVHRDLKPHNVMVGAFGEVQVMDWGLAKVLTGPERSQPEAVTVAGAMVASVVRVSRADADSAKTREGDVLGTPAYMPPEQALGEISRLDPRTDVFSLGAILCEVLTGLPPYVGADGTAVLRQARRAELGDALRRLDGCGADEELVGLARRCLAPEPNDRPRDAGAVAKAVEAYLAGVEERARQAEVERAAAEARVEEARATAREAEAREVAEKKQAEEAQARAAAEQARAEEAEAREAAQRARAAEAEARAAAERRAKRMTMGLAASVLLLVVGGGVGAWLVQQQRAEAAARRQRADDLTLQAVERGRVLLRKGWEKYDKRALDDAGAEADKAVEFARGDAALKARQEAKEFQEEVRRKLDQWAKNEKLLTALLDVSAPRERRYEQGESGRMEEVIGPSPEEQFTRAFRAWDKEIDIERDPVEVVAARLGGQPRQVVEQMVAVLEAWMLGRRYSDRAGSERLLRLANLLDDDRGRREVRGLLVGNRLTGERAIAALTPVLLPWSVLGEPYRGPARRRLEERADKLDTAKEPVLGVVSLARALGRAGAAPEAERLLRRVLAARPGEVVLLTELGELLEWQRRWPEAVGCYRAARALRPDLGVALAEALLEAGGGAEAEEIFRYRTGKEPLNPKRWADLGFALWHRNKLVEAEAAFRRAIPLDPDLAGASLNLGSLLRAQNNLGEAETAIRKAIAFEPDDDTAYWYLGNVLRDQKKLSDAVAAYRKALELNPNFADAYKDLGLALAAQKKLADAESAFRRAIALKPDHAGAQFYLGNALAEQKKPAQAESAFRRAIALKPDHAGAHFRLGAALYDQKKPVQAEAAFRRAIALQPNLAEAHNGLGAALHVQEKLDEAESAYRKAIALKPDFGEAHEGLGSALSAQKKLAEAVAAFRKADQLLPNHPLILRKLRIAQRWLELDRRMPEILGGRAKPVSPQEQIELAQFCDGFKESPHAAARFYADAFAADPRLASDLRAQHRYCAACDAALAAAGKGRDAGRLPERVVLTLRRQALRWLRADLAAYTEMAGRDDPRQRQVIGQRLAHWQEDADLAGLRDEKALAKLPPDERTQWQKLWADVAELRKKAGGKP